MTKQATINSSRRDFLLKSGSGFGGIALSALMAQDGLALSPHFKPTAKSVIWCFLDGGASHMDLFDPKPLLNELHGKPLPDSFQRPARAAATPVADTGSSRAGTRRGTARVCPMPGVH